MVVVASWFWLVVLVIRASWERDRTSFLVNLLKPQGADFIDQVGIPNNVMDAYQRLAVAHPHSLRKAWRP